MPKPNERGGASLNKPGSPKSNSTDSSRKDSLRQLHREKDPEPPTPSSPPARLTRKRAATLDVESANQPNISGLALDSASTNGPPSSDLTREQVCLCQPDPKIPRPRNAFILYRQHYQAMVVSQHPGLANPEISKIIGEQWREQPAEVKNEWKRLAEEEKQRHQRQYPGYRYQPRRAGKGGNGNNSSSTSPDSPPTRCPKCGGRYISTPSTPLTPFIPAFGAPRRRSESLIHPFPPALPAEIERPRYPPTSMQLGRMDSPRAVSSYQQMHRRHPYPPPQPLHTHHERDDEMELSSPTPDQKRRRFNESQRGYPIPSPGSYTTSQPYRREGPAVPPSTFRQYIQDPRLDTRQEHLPGSAIVTRQGPMGPPTQQSPMHHQPPRHQFPTGSNTFDESLRLPPLQTQIPPTPVSAHRHSGDQLRRDSREIRARTVETMVMTIPYIQKIKVLAKISPPLAPPGSMSPAQTIRGALVAIEGPDKKLLAQIGTFLNDHLTSDASCAVKTWNINWPSFDSTATDIEMTDLLTPAPRAEKPADAFVEYLSIISDMHRESHSIVKYITSVPNPGPVSQPDSETQNKSKIIPIALLPNGFSLTTSDVFALRIPINDKYAPVDHWQWMATLWRGIVGPDLTIYIHRVGKEELSKYGGVEMRVQECGAIVVRVPEEGEMDEKTTRRLGFEVLEIVRSGFTGRR